MDVAGAVALVTGAGSGIAELSPAQWQAIAPAAMSRPDEIADAVVRLIVDDSLAGRVMLCVGPQPWPLMEPSKRPP